MLSLNQIISQITTLASAHYQIAESGVGDFAEWQAKERNYPLLWVFHEQSSINERYLVHDIRLICADRVITGEEGDDTEGHEQEVLSDTQLVLLDFLAYFNNQYGQDYDIIRTATIEPFTERFNDRVAGNSVVIQIRQRWEWNKCSIPESGAVIPPTVDGLTLYDFSDPTVFARLTAQQLTDLETLLCACDDATVTINGSSLGATGTIPSGGSVDIDVTQGGSPVGSWNGSAWIIPTSTAPSLTITFYSDAGLTTPITTANYGQTVYINAVATGITPTSHTFALTNGTKSRSFIQAGATLTWTVDIYGAVSVRAAATDGSEGTSVTSSSTLTVSVAITKWLSLDGVTDHGVVGLPRINYNVAWSVSFTFQMNSTAGRTVLYSMSAVNAAGRPATQMYYESNAFFFLGGGANWNFNRTLAWTGDTDQHHFVVRWDSTSTLIEIFIDGVSIGTFATSIWDFPFWSLVIGRGFANFTSYGNVKIGDFRVFNHALTNGEVASLQTLGTVIGTEKMWLPFTEAVGTTDTCYDIVNNAPLVLYDVVSPYGVVAI